MNNKGVFQALWSYLDPITQWRMCCVCKNFYNWSKKWPFKLFNLRLLETTKGRKELAQNGNLIKITIGPAHFKVLLRKIHGCHFISHMELFAKNEFNDRHGFVRLCWVPYAIMEGDTTQRIRYPKVEWGNEYGLIFYKTVRRYMMDVKKNDAKRCDMFHFYRYKSMTGTRGPEHNWKEGVCTGCGKVKPE